MKRNRKHNMFGWLAASALLLTTACADNADLLQGGSTDATNVVTFTVQTEMGAGGTRSIETGNTKISKGYEIDVLIFAVYEVNDDGSYTVAQEFCKGDQTTTTKKPPLGTGQNAIDFSATEETTIELLITSDKTYRIAFWAQSSECTAYDTKDLTAVSVDYGSTTQPAANNNELRDAFCAVSEPFTADDKVVTTKGDGTKVILRRPFAQVNVGTVGWDYESAAVLEPNVFYKDSYIELTGVADNYDVLTGKATVSSGSESSLTAKFDYAKIPAFINIEEIKDNKWVGENDEVEDKKIYEPFTNEEYLKVKLYKNVQEDGSYKYDDYLKWDNKYLTMAREDLDDEKTEEYKYLSMCYVLVPTNKDATGTTLESVKFGFKGYTYNEENDTFSGDGKEFPLGKDKDTDGNLIPAPFEVRHVPVQANWRTNILGNNFFLFNEVLNVWINQDYFGDYNDNAYDDGTLQGRWPHTMDFCNDEETKMDDFFTLYNGDKQETTYTRADLTGTSVYNGTNYTQGLKLDDNTKITFASKEELFITIVMSTAGEDESKPGSILLDSKSLEGAKTYKEEDPQNKNVRIYTTTLPAIIEEKDGQKVKKEMEHTISGVNNPVVLFLCVVAREQNKGESSKETTQQ